jgi:sigma-B regulation protein RsbU (phosphoserine phosphatase)
VYATAVCALVDWARGTMSVACAGHPPPLRYRPGHEVLPIPCEATTPLLLTDLDEVPSTTHDLRPGDRLLFYTDGVTDREAPSGVENNAERLARSLSRSGDQPVERAVASIVDDVETFAGGREPQDDSTLLLMSMQ